MIFINAPIGAGKTSLAKILSQDLDTKAYLEDPSKIPMLNDFYNGGKISRELQAYGVQMEFLSMRYQQEQAAIIDQRNGMRNTIFDSSLLSDGLMSRNLYNRGEFPEQLYIDYRKISQIMQANILSSPFNGPDLVIYLDLPFSLMLEHIQKRGRKMETEDPKLKEYYQSVWQIYRDWAHSYNDTMMTIDLNKYDVVNSMADRIAVLEQIETMMHKLGRLSPTELAKLKAKHQRKENHTQCQTLSKPLE